MRKSKFDWFIFYDPKQDRILEAQWDHAVDRVPEWFIFDGARARYIRGHGVRRGWKRVGYKAIGSHARPVSVWALAKENP